MKNIYRFISVMVLFMAIFFSKTAKTQSSDNYYKLVDSLETYFNAHPDLKQDTDGEYAQYIRSKIFWENRVYGGDSSKRGSFQLFREAVKNYVDNINFYQRSTLIGSDWHCLGPDNETDYPFRGLVSSVYVDTAADKNMNTIYIGTNASGIWKTTDGGQNWHNVTDPSGITLLGIDDITGDPNNGNIIYAGTGFFSSDLIHSGGVGIIRSNDGGVTWEQILSFQPEYNNTVFKLLVDPYYPRRIYALINNLLLRNTNGGVGTWDTIFTCSPIFGQIRNLRDILMKPGDNTTLYVAADDRDPSGWSYELAKVYKIKNATSTNLNSIYAVCLDSLLTLHTIPGDTIFTQRYQIAVTPADTSAIYIGCEEIRNLPYPNNFRVKVWKYDNVNSWKKIIDYYDDYRDVNWNKITMLVSPSDTGVVYIGGIRFIQFIHGHSTHSDDGHIHDDIRYAKVYQKVPAASGMKDIIYMGHDGGIGMSNNGLLNCQNLNGHGLVITEFWGIGGADKIPDRIYAGAQDNHLFVYNGGNWTNPTVYFVGDAGNNIVDYRNPDTLFYVGWGGGASGVLRSTNAALNYSTSFNPTETYNFNIPLGINPLNHKSIYIGCHSLWRSFHYGDYGTYSRILIPFGDTIPDPISAFTIAPSDSMIIYVAFDGPYDYWGHKQHEKFVKTTNGGTSWTDLTQATTAFQNLSTQYGITSIEVSPTHPDSVWISFGGYWNQWDPAHHRVLLSINGGNTWNIDSNYSAGLPNTPVNCLKYMKGNSRRIFAGTDVGVFYRDKYSSEWQPFNTGLPICPVINLVINNTTQKIRAGTFGRGLYETNLTCDYNSNEWVINSNITITNDTAIAQSIRIDSSYTLTVKARLKFPPEGIISVEPGAKLIVDGGTLTNRCYNMWRGVRVISHTNLKQNTFNQGYANFKNGAVLENARIGVSTNGGIITADSAIFRNNYNAVKFESYQYDQLSSFKRVTFETTSNYLDTNYSVPQDFVSLWNVKGVSFRGCTFQNTTVPPNGVPGSLKGRGIYSINATYTVDRYEYCPVLIVPCPHPQYTPTIFKGLYYGIRVYNSDPTKYVQILHSTFDHNYRGVYLGTSNYSTLTQNNFLVPNHTQAGNDTCYGLYLGTCSGYHVEANNFSSPGNTLLQSGGLTLREIGLIVDNSGGSPNEIYRNYFDTLDIAVNAQRVNRQDGGAIPDGPIGGGGVPYPNGNPTGLVIKCNTYKNNSFDEMATRYYTSGLEGIAKYQGAKTTNAKDQASNTFSPYHVQVQIPETDIKNLADNFIYFHQIQPGGTPPPRVDPIYHTPAPKVVDSLVNNSYDSAQCCPSKLPSGNQIAYDLKRDISGEITVIDSLITILKSLVDGGKTDDLNNTITYSTPPDALDVQQNLLNSSPYLSDTVMKSAIEKESVLPNEMIRDILVANPQSAKNDDVLNSLNERYIPMPDSMMAEIMDGKDKLSPKEELEAQIALHMQSFKDAYNSLVLFYKIDSVSSQTRDSLIIFLGTVGDLDGKYLLAFEYLFNGDTSNVNNTLNFISRNFTLDKGQRQQYQDYISYFAFLKSLKSPEKDILTLDTNQISRLQTLYSTATEPVSSYIRSILIANDVSSYIEPIIIPDDKKSAPEVSSLKTSHFGQGCYLKLFPNPAKQYIIAEYNAQHILTGNNEFLLSIVSNEGKLVESRILNKLQDQVLISTTSYNPGIYVCCIKSGNKIIASRKFTVIQ